MESIRKIKKLLKRYPILIEFKMPEMPYTQQQCFEIKQRLHKGFGDQIIIAFTPYVKQPIGIIIPKNLEDIDLEKLKAALLSASCNDHNVRLVSNETQYIPLNQSSINICSMFKLSKQQHKELLQGIKDSQPQNNFK